MKPLIGISPTPEEKQFEHGDFRRYALANTYTNAVLAAGGIPVILPAHDGMIDDLLDTLDGIIFSGGSDINSARWNEEAHPASYGFDDERDEFELQAIRKVVGRDMPLLGICRGIQSVNVALGGTIVQDIPDQVPGAIEHRQQKDGKKRDTTSHSITIAEGDNLLHRIHGDATMDVNSFHHQAIRDLGDGLEVIATAEDGVIEAVWHPNMTFGLAVQWHPEMLAEDVADQAEIFTAFVRAAAEHKAARMETAVSAS